MQSRVKRRLRTLFATVIFAVGASVFADEDRPRIIVVLDASGSMWGHLLDDQPKITAAKKVVHDLLADWDPNVWLGLTVYGHRQKGACDDIETLVPVGPVERKTVLERVDAIQPKGKTPMTEAVRRAAAELKYTESKAQVILVSDGEETCDADPCEAARVLEEAGVDLTVHTIGFDVVEKKGEDQLRCIAENTGGRFLLAEDGASLKKAIDAAVEVAVAPAAVPTEPPPTDPPATPTPRPQAQAPAPPQNILPRGGHGHEDAVALAPGDYIVNWDLASNVFEFWKFEGKPGQLVRIDLRVSPDRGYTGGALAVDKKDLAREGCPNQPSVLFWLPSSARDSYPYVVSLGGCNGVAVGSGLAIALEDRFDAGSTTDAGDEFDSALAIEPGNVAGFLAADYRGDDKRDYFRIRSVGAGKEIKMKVVPPTDVGYRLTMFDQDRVEVAEKQSANPGAIVRLAWTPAEDQEEVFLLVRSSAMPSTAESLSYKIELEVKP